MSFVTKEWKDRLAEFAGRRKLTNVSTGEETTVDVSRAEGEVSQAGDAFSAANMNDLEQRIKDGFDKVDTNLEWKFLGSVSNNNTLTLPSDFNELFIKTYQDVGTNFAFNIPRKTLTDIKQGFRGGYYNSSTNNISVQINISLSELNAVMFLNGSTIEYTTEIYYR